ncbi:MAG: BREX system Lon protease-like protein BrxL [Bacteroidales bacterium]|nr:BREX system Lon protease-like protein BrxL [Bacteroidales bacterium]
MLLQDKVLAAFPGKVVRKDLAFQVKGGLPVPTYVLEYLLGQYCATDDEETIEQGLAKVKEVIQNNYVHRAEDEIIKSRIREQGRYRIIDKVTVVLNEKDDEYVASFANLGLHDVPINSQYIKDNPKLLSGNGVWCIVTLGYIPGDDVKQRWEIQILKPVQISRIDIEEYISKRSEFTTGEWIDFLIHTCGLNPDALTRREKFITLARLLPHIENNFNFMELGPKGTGKSHIFQELSPYGVLVSGGDVTVPRLFVSMSGRNEVLGLVGYWDVVAWDEYEQQKGRNIDATLIDVMQNYLANQAFNRGRGRHEASASMVFVGNTKHTVPYMLKNSHMFESIPTSFIKGAFLDRVHFYNPGWEIKPLKKSSFSKSYGLITDYIAAVLHGLRDRDLTGLLKQYASFDESLTERDHNAIRKTFSGLVKLLYPDGNMTDEEAYELVDFAAEMRKRVKDQLPIIDPTIEPATFRYQKPGHEEWINVETLEKVSNALIVPQPSAVTIECPASSSPLSSNNKGVKDEINKPKRPRIDHAAPQLAQGQRRFRSGQTGVGYRELFGDYFANSREITVEDPYLLNNPHMIRNFMEFVAMLMDTRDVEGLKIHMITKEDPDDNIQSVIIDRRDDMIDDLLGFGIEMTHEFRDFHDRFISTDDGWSMGLGRGFDFYEKYDPLTIAAYRPERRKCKEFFITYNHK